MIMPKKLQNKLNLLLLLILVTLGVIGRTYRLNAPLADWHSWRQVDTASVAREYVKNGIDLSRPTYHDLSSIPSGLDNPNGYRFVEFPLISALHAKLATNFPQLGIVEWGRVLSIVSSSLSIIVIYLIMNLVTTPLAALVAAGVFATLPYNLFYGRVVLPEPHLVFFSLVALHQFLKYWNTGKLGYWITFTVFLTLAVLMKPTALIILIPMGLFALISGTLTIGKSSLSLVAFIISLLPYLAWRRYIAAFPAGIPANAWLFNGNGIRFKGAWFRWLFGDRIGRLILGYWGLIPAGFGLLALGRSKKETAVVGGMVVGALAYMAVIATGNVQHDYYQIQIIPAIAMLIGVGVDYVISLRKTLLSKITLSALLVFIFLLSTALAWYEVRGYFNINNPAIVAAGQEIDTTTPADALVIAPYMGDTAFLFQTNRRGWPIGENIDLKIKAGASYYVTTSRDKEYSELKSKYTLVKETDQFSIIKLTPNGKTD
jgi:hypothetical protein